MEIIKNNNWDGVLIPPILYKYRDWDNPYHKTILTNNELYFASPIDFHKEDHYDCNVEEIYPKTDGELMTYIFKIYWGRKKFDSYGLYRDKFIEWCQNVIESCSFKNKHNRKKILMQIKNDYYKSHGVFSTTVNNNNEYMWRHYAHNYKGFCVGFDSNILKHYVGGAGPVIYTKQLPIVNYIKDSLEEEINKKVYHKLEKFKDEQEYRITLVWQNIVSAKDRKIYFPSDAIHEIILGRNMKKENKQEIKNIVKNKFSQAKITEQ